MISGLVPEHKGNSGLLPLAAELPREFQAAYYFKVILRKKRHFISFLNLHTKGILSKKEVYSNLKIVLEDLIYWDAFPVAGHTTWGSQ